MRLRGLTLQVAVTAAAGARCILRAMTLEETMRNIASRLAVVVALCLATTSLLQSPASAGGTFALAPNTMSRQFTATNSCLYQVSYGTFGDAYARLRVYNGAACGTALLSVRTTGGSYYSAGGWTAGTDNCGSYFQLYAHGPGAGAAANITWTSNNDFYVFQATGTATIPATSCQPNP